MKKIMFLLFLATGVIGCSVDSLDTNEELLTADAKYSTQDVENSMHLEESEICAGEAPVFVFNFPQNTKGNDDPKDTDIHIQLYNAEIDDWESFKKLSYPGAGPEEYTYEDEVLEVGSYSFRAKIGKEGFNYDATLTVIDCCEEDFSYMDNEDGTYTFKYTAGEDMDDAILVFTFAQGAYDSGLSDNFSQNGNNGQTYEATMNLEKCDVLEYTVTLTPKCSGNSNESNVWTDFKINDVSKKADEEDKFIASCG